LLFILLVSYFTSIYCIKWEDCGIPLTRKIYFHTVVVSPTTINIAEETSDHSISINVGADLQNYKFGGYSPSIGTDTIKNVTSYLEVIKDGQTYLDTAIGDLCTLLSTHNGAACPISSGSFSYSYKYSLPPLPSGNYTVRLVHKENTTEAEEIGCLSVQIQIIGLSLDSCAYSSSLSAVFSGTAQFLDDNTTIQIGPWGPGGKDLGYPWGTFRSITASPDLVGYSLNSKNFVWGLRGTLDPARNTFSGVVHIGYLPDTKSYLYAQLIYQGTFSWNMAPNSITPFVFKSGYFDFVPPYSYPYGFPYPLNIGNLGTLTISQSSDRSYFSIAATKQWCRCNCDIGGVGHDDSLKSDNGNSGKGMSGWIKGTIAIAVIGTFIIIVAIFAIVKMRRSRPRPVVYDDADLMDPQKPDYGTLAIKDAFDDQDQEFD